MELLNFLSQVPVPILILVIAVLVVVTAVVVYQYAKAKGLEGIRKEVYELFCVRNTDLKNPDRASRN